MVFGRGRKAKQEQLTEPGETPEAVLRAPPRMPPTARSGAATGPFDVSEIENQDGYVDLGALLIAPQEGLQLRLEVEEATQRVVAVTMDLNGSSLQLQAFAAPRSEGLWDEIREQIGQSVGSQGGQVEEIQGSFGTELLAKLPASGSDGSHGYRVARFIGVDGPRWFLRGVLGGEAAVDRDAAAGLEACSGRSSWSGARTRCRRATCCSCACPRTPRHPAPKAAPDLEQPERGPEITQIG